MPSRNTKNKNNTNTSSAQKGLEQLKQRIAELKALLSYLSKALSKTIALGDTHYTVLLQQHIEAVLAYKNITQHWPEQEQARAKTCIDEAITQHSQWKRQLEEQHKQLGLKIDRIAASPNKCNKPKPNYKYNNDHTSRMFDLRG